MDDKDGDTMIYPINKVLLCVTHTFIVLKDFVDTTPIIHLNIICKLDWFKI